MMDVLTLKVNPTLSFKAMLEAGHYDEVADDFNQRNFQLPNLVVANREEAELVSFDHRVYLPEVKSFFQKRNLYHGTLPELLALGAQRPNLQRTLSIIALGTLYQEKSLPSFLYKGSSYAPYLYGNERKRGIDIFWADDQWEEGWTFLGIRGTGCLKKETL